MLKRSIDFILSFVALVLVSPLFLPIAILLRLTGEGKVFFKQERIGRNGKPFGLLKFATMRQNSSNMAGGDITQKNDPRVLPVGKYLRKSKLNELPQLLNIILGHMSIIGPRPLPLKNFNYYSEDVRNAISTLRPGLSGIGSLVFRDEEKFIQNSPKEPLDFYKNDIAPFKGELEYWYFKNRSGLLDFKIIFFTAYLVLFSKSNIISKYFPTLPKNSIFNP